LISWHGSQFQGWGKSEFNRMSAGAARRPVVRQPRQPHVPPGDPDNAQQITRGET